MRMFIASKNKYLSNDMKIFGTCSIPLSTTASSSPGFAYYMWSTSYMYDMFYIIGLHVTSMIYLNTRDALHVYHSCNILVVQSLGMLDIPFLAFQMSYSKIGTRIFSLTIDTGTFRWFTPSHIEPYAYN